MTANARIRSIANALADIPARLWQAGGAAALPPLAGLCFGLALARALWETWPFTFAAIGRTPALAWALGGAGALAFWALWRARRGAAADFAPFFLLLVDLLAPDVNIPRAWVLLAGSALLAGAVALRRRALSSGDVGDVAGRSATALPRSLLAFTGLAALAVYLATLGQYVGKADAFEFQVTAPVLGIAHPTGYPLYTLLGWLCSLLPVGSMAWRVNLSAALPAAAAVMALAWLVARLGVGRPLAVIAALTLAFSETFWSQAVEAEVYALNAFFVVVILGILIGWQSRARSPAAAPGAEVYLLALAFGLGLTNHVTLVLLAPAAALTLLQRRPQLTARQWAVAALLFAAALSLYLYLPLRWPALHGGAPMSPQEFIDWVTGQRFGGALIPEYWSQPDRWLAIGRLILQQFGVVGLALGVVGLARLARWFPEIGVMTLVAYGAYFVYALVYIVPDIEVFLIPMHIIQVIWIAYALHAVREWAGKLDLAGRRVYVPLHTLAALLPLALLWTNAAARNPAEGREAEAWGRHVLSLPLAEGAAVLADSEKIAPLEYLHRIEGLRPDMDMVVLGNEDIYRAVLTERLAAGQTVYLARYLPRLEGAYHLRSAGPLVEVGTEPLAAPPASMTPLDVTFGGWARLLGYAAEETDLHNGEAARITLYWQREGAPGGPYQVRLRLVDAAGAVVWEARDRYAVNNMYPANAWKEGEVIPDYHEIPFDHGLAPGVYRLEAGLFLPFAAEGLPVSDGDGAWAAVTAFTVTPASAIPTPPTQVRAPLSDDLLLLGYDMPPSATEGQALTLKLYLLALSDLGGAQIAVREAGQEPARAGDPPIVIDLPPLAAGERFVAAAQLHARAPSAQYSIAANGPGGDAFRLPAVAVAPTPPQGLANFDGRALLVEARYSAETLEPGALLDVFLVWQPLQPFDKDYTVTVQLIGPDGVLYGQTDSYPVQGTHPTSRWEVGERIADGYQVRLADDAPPGAYQVQVGLYLLATLERLPVVDDTGAEVDNRYILGTIAVGR